MSILITQTKNTKTPVNQVSEKTMFKKLITNLPFNPSLLETVSFYAKRAKQEESLRRLGFLFVALAMFIQMFAVMAPPEKSLAYSSDYIINGLRTRDDILRAWDGQTSDRNVAEIYSKFGLNRQDIQNLDYYPNSRIYSNQADYWTIGRTSLSAVSKSSKIKSQYKNSEVAVNTGSTTVYLRQLKAWDIVNPVNSYNAFRGTKDGKPFWILVDCGNFTQVGPPNLTSPGLDLRKTIDGGPRTLKPGDSFNFRFEYRNNVPNSRPAENVQLVDTFDLKNFDIVSPTNLNMLGDTLFHNIGTVAYDGGGYKTALVVTARLKNALPNGTKACNASKLQASNAADAWSGGPTLCITVNKPEPKRASLVCTITTTGVNRTTKEYTLTTTVNSSDQTLTKVTGYEYDFGDGSPVVSKNSNLYTDSVKHTYKDGTYDATVIVNYRNGDENGMTDENTACATHVESSPDEPLSQNKTAKNLTQDLNEEQILNAKVKGGDTIEYSLTTYNSYGYDRANVATSDYIGDLLDYADLDVAFLEQQGGKFNEETKTVSWNPETVPANGKITKIFRIKIKNPIPATNQPSVLTTSFDCQISNRFGDQLDLEVDCPLPKSSEYITKRLPNTGPGSSLIIGFIATTIVAYFFARSRLLAQELDIIRTDFAQTGGV